MRLPVIPVVHENANIFCFTFFCSTRRSCTSSSSSSSAASATSPAARLFARFFSIPRSHRMRNFRYRSRASTRILRRMVAFFAALVFREVESAHIRNIERRKQVRFAIRGARRAASRGAACVLRKHAHALLAIRTAWLLPVRRRTKQAASKWTGVKALVRPSWKRPHGRCTRRARRRETLPLAVLRARARNSR